MKLLKQATEQNNVRSSKRVVYENVKFANGFVPFMESLVLNKLVDPTYNRINTDVGFLWDDSRKHGGVLIETSDYPILVKWPTVLDQTNTLIVEGVTTALDVFESLLSQHGVTFTPLHEVIVVSDLNSPNVDFSKIDKSTEMHVFDIQGHPVYQYTSADDVFLILKVQGIPAAYVSYNKMKLHGYTYIYIKRAYTEQQFRGNAYAINIIVQLRRRNNIKLLGDEEMTSAGKDMWIKLQRYFPVKVIDILTGELFDFDAIPLNQIFVKSEQDNKYLLVVEQLRYIQQLVVEQHGPDDGISKSYECIFIEQDETLKNI